MRILASLSCFIRHTGTQPTPTPECPPKPPSNPRLDEDTLLAYVEGRLDADTRRRVDEHLDQDDEAREVVAALSELSLLRSGSRRSRARASSTLPAQPDVTTEPTSGDELVDQYRVVGLLGRGAMGVVLDVEHLHLGERRALKLIHRPDGDGEEHTERLIREARATMDLAHANLAKVYDLGRLEDGRLFLVMERLEGEDLRSRLRRAPPTPELAARFVAQAARGVAAAHASGVVHRDIKPANLYVTTEGIKVLDFGLSKVTAKHTPADRGELTTSSSILGSPMYMSPEQIRDARSVDERTDVWSLGVVLYEALAGTPPFAAETVSGLLAAIIADEPGPIDAERQRASSS